MYESVQDFLDRTTLEEFYEAGLLPKDEACHPLFSARAFEDETRLIYFRDLECAGKIPEGTSANWAEVMRAAPNLMPPELARRLLTAFDLGLTRMVRR